jgi:hypothetical protein
MHCPPITAFHHHRHQSVHILATERRLDHSSRASPHVTIAYDQAVAEQHLNALKTRAFVVLAMAAGQDAPNLGRIVDKIRESTIRFRDAHHIPIIELYLLQRRQGVGVDTENDRRIGTWGFPEFSLDGRHGGRIQRYRIEKAGAILH